MSDEYYEVLYITPSLCYKPIRDPLAVIWREIVQSDIGEYPGFLIELHC